MLKNLYPYKNQWKKVYITSFENLFASHKNIIDLKRIGAVIVRIMIYVMFLLDICVVFTRRFALKVDV